MGYKAPDVMIQLIGGAAVEDPLYTGLDECTADNADSCVAQ
jgi:ribose transport system substrate-binding protein